MTKPYLIRGLDKKGSYLILGWDCKWYHATRKGSAVEYKTKYDATRFIFDNMAKIGRESAGIKLYIERWEKES